MFDVLAGKLQSAIERVARRGRLDEKTLESALREIRFALLEADVNYKVVSKFIERVREKVKGVKGASGMSAVQQVSAVVYSELVDVLGGKTAELELTGKPSTILLIGLQGSGKTTTAVKLAVFLKKQGKKVLLTSTDIYRPAAMLQLKRLSEKAGLPAFLPEGEGDPVEIATKALEEARKSGYDVLVVDTAGRLHVDEEMLEEARRIKERIAPEEVLFVVDSMMGQEAVNVASSFDKSVGMTGIVITKLDSDARGGVALSVKYVTGKPVKFSGVGEKVEDFEPFHPDRIASRILGMGDVASLAEKAQEVIDEQTALDMRDRILSGDFTLEDFHRQIKMIRKLGPLHRVVSMLPGLGSQKALKQLQRMVDDEKLKRIEAIINSMTIEERRNHTIINASRKRRIAKGSGTTVKEVDALLKQFAQTKLAFKKMRKLKRMRKGGGLPFPWA